MLKHTTWKNISDILYSNVKGDGLNGYRTNSIRLMLTLMRRIGWVQPKHLHHFEMVLWQEATETIQNGMWVGTKSDCIRYKFWGKVANLAADKARDYADKGLNIKRAAERPAERLRIGIRAS